MCLSKLVGWLGFVDGAATWLWQCEAFGSKAVWLTGDSWSSVIGFIPGPCYSVISLTNLLRLVTKDYLAKRSLEGTW